MNQFAQTKARLEFCQARTYFVRNMYIGGAETENAGMKQRENARDENIHECKYRHFPPLQDPADISTPAFSTSALKPCRFVHSCTFSRPCIPKNTKNISTESHVLKATAGSLRYFLTLPIILTLNQQPYRNEGKCFLSRPEKCVSGSRVMGQMGHRIGLGHVGHGSLYQYHRHMISSIELIENLIFCHA